MESKGKQHGDLGPQYLAAIIVNVLSFAYGMTIGWAAPMQPLLQFDPDLNETSPLGEGVASMTDEQVSWIGGAFCIGGMLGTPLYGYFANTFGRKKTLILSAVPFLAGFVLIAFATDPLYIFIARVVLGFGGAGTCVIVPMYIGETAEDKIRGVLGSCFNLFLCTGILAAYVVGSYTSYMTLAILSLLCAVGFLGIVAWVPETPVYSLIHDRPDDAFRSLIKLRGNHRELVEMQVLTISSSVKEMSNNNGSLSIRGMLSDTPTRRALIIGTTLLTIQQCSGISPVLHYTVFIFEASGSDIAPSIAAIIVGSLQIIGAILGSVLMDRAGRKFLLMLSSLLMAFTLTPIAYFFYLKNNDMLTPCWNWVPVTSMAVYIVAFALGYGCVPFVLFSELFRPEARSMGTSICVVYVWFLSFLVLKYFSAISASFGIDACFAFFAICCVFGFFFVYFYIIETKGKPLEEILADLGAESNDTRSSPIPFLNGAMEKSSFESGKNQEKKDIER